MKVFSPEAHALIEQMAVARREARDNGPRQSNDHLEAAMVLAMVDRLISLRAEQERPSEADQPPPGDPIVEVQPSEPELPLPEAPRPPSTSAHPSTSAQELPPVLYAEGDVNANG